MKSECWPKGDGTNHPIFCLTLGPVHRLRSCNRFIVHGRDADTIDGVARRQTVEPCGLTSAHRQAAVRFSEGTIGNQCMIGDRGDCRGKSGSSAATSRLRINGRDLIHAEITRGGPDAIVGEGSIPRHRNRMGAHTGIHQIPEFRPEGSGPVGAQIVADFPERNSIGRHGGHGGHGDIARHRVPCLRADGEDSVRADSDRMGPTDPIGRVPRG
jgi:hypothetical protein